MSAKQPIHQVNRPHVSAELVGEGRQGNQVTTRRRRD